MLAFDPPKIDTQKPGKPMEQFEPKIRSAFTKCSIHVFSRFDGIALSKAATAFLYRTSGQLFLLTARHNVTGRHHQTGQCLLDNGGVPDELICTLRHKNEEGDGFILKTVRLPLFLGSDVYSRPIWLEHPTGGRDYDVVALKVRDDTDSVISFHHPINEVVGSSLPLSPGDDCFIIGFPRDKASDNRLPIWKRGSIASEPGFSVEEQPMFFVDTVADKGLSGAPVVARFSGFWNDDTPYVFDKMKSDTNLGVGYQFIGMYTGRYGDGVNEAQLGMVYRATVIEEICKSDSTPVNPHV